MNIKLTFVIFFISVYVFGQELSELRYVDKIRIKEALTIAEKFGDGLWEGYNDVPFAIILVTDNMEFLINHPNPSNDFSFLKEDKLLKSKVYYRKRQYNKYFLATFPAVNGLSCIVVGTPENTNKNSTEWIITLLHEHFHQYQNGSSGYYESVDNLNLSNGDKTGMWMLNYPFPYDNLSIIDLYKKYTKNLYSTVTSINKRGFRNKLKQYTINKKSLKTILDESDYRYFSFQIWQEGIARYTEYKFLELLKDYNPSKEVVTLPDFEPFNVLKKKIYNNEMKSLLENKLSIVKRVSFYSIGFAEGLILDKLNKKWRKNYLKDKFYIEHYSGQFKK